MENVLVVYKTDANHTYASRNMIGIASDDHNAQMICKERAYKEGNNIIGDAWDTLVTLNQTQGYQGEGEFQIEEIPLDTHLKEKPIQ